MSVEPLFDLPVYGLDHDAKQALLLAELNRLTGLHRAGCTAYADILSAYGRGDAPAASLADIPFLPVRLFKQFDLASVPADQLIKTMTSSGTTGQAVSRIHLDRPTAGYQTTAMVRIMQQVLGRQRLPMLVIDHPGILRDRASFSARGAGIMGFLPFGRQPLYVLADGDMALDLDGLEAHAAAHGDGPVLLFGFTFMVWRYLVGALRAAGRRIHLPGGILVHSGGWKKLEDEAVDNATFKAALAEWTGITRVHNFYGMVEQVGAIHVECGQGALHTPLYADILIRDPLDWRPLPPGQEGVIEVLSCLPHSYPGHALLTEDRGILLGEDDCPCGQKGKYFRVLGRLPRAELRGCSDTHAASAA